MATWKRAEIGERIQNLLLTIKRLQLSYGPHDTEISQLLNILVIVESRLLYV